MSKAKLFGVDEYPVKVVFEGEAKEEAKVEKKQGDAPGYQTAGDVLDQWRAQAVLAVNLISHQPSQALAHVDLASELREGAMLLAAVETAGNDAAAGEEEPVKVPQLASGLPFMLFEPYDEPRHCKREHIYPLEVYVDDNGHLNIAFGDPSDRFCLFCPPEDIARDPANCAVESCDDPMAVVGRLVLVYGG
jgi:hypothetical protein